MLFAFAFALLTAFLFFLVFAVFLHLPHTQYLLLFIY